MNNNYQIFLIQGSAYAELDCEDLDMVTTISITDVSDLSTKNDNISQNIKLKATKNNNRVLGNLFNSSRFVDSSSTMLNRNFSLNRKVECVVFENSVQIIRGYLKVIDVAKINGEITYDCIITGNIFNFFSQLGDRLLSDLDFSEYSHTYNVLNIQSSWFNTSGFTYPMINYGDKSSPDSSKVNQIHINNFRPAIFLTAYLNKLFNQPELSGFTYEIKGSADFKSEINGLIVPNDSDSFTQVSTGSTLITLDNTGSVGNANSRVTPGVHLYRAINFPSKTDPKNFLQANTSNFFGQNNNLFTWKREITSDIKITLDVYISNNNSNAIKTSIQFLERDSSGDDNLDNFPVTEEVLIANISGNSTISKTVTLIVPQKLFNEGRQFGVVFKAEASGVSFNSGTFDFNITNAQIVTPSVTTNKVVYSVVKGDTVIPMPVSGIRQKDFIKSFCLLYNLYSYSSMDNPKHIIFETYNDYYSKAKSNNLVGSALDWTYKVDHSSKLIVSSFNDTAKKYLFSYKSDGDYFNSLYTSKYGEVYGEYTETDSTGNGINDEKRIELVFSPTPLVTYNNSNRMTPEIYKLNSDNSRSTFKSNIRLLHYNGTKSCNDYQIGTMDSSYNFTPIIESPLSGTFNTYPQCGHIRLATGLSNFKYVSDLNFAPCKEHYFLANNSIQSLPNQYTRLYKDQIIEYSDLNTTLFECDILLDPLDISNLDLKVPVFINCSDGGAYYKVLNVDYYNRYEPSPVKLQKIIF